jgi:hypothetical protein
MKKMLSWKTKNKMAFSYIPRDKLYSIIEEKIFSLGYTYDDYPIDPFKIAEALDIKYEFIDYGSHLVGGQIYIGKNLTRISLNNKRSLYGKRFDCMHEIIHYWLHPSDGFVNLDQDGDVEWQANEGAAHALMPKKLFKQKYIEYDGNIKKLSNFFKIGIKAVEYRVKNLNFDLFIPKFNICSSCDNAECIENTTYCSICGNLIVLKQGAIKMIYKKRYKTDEDKKMLKCPICGNEEISHSASHCKICGFYLFNLCANEGDPGDFFFSESCNTILDSNARFCHNCGKKSTFYEDGLLEKWYLEKFINYYSSKLDPLHTLDKDYIRNIWLDIRNYYKELNKNFYNMIYNLDFINYESECIYLQTNTVYFVKETITLDLEYIFKNILNMHSIKIIIYDKPKSSIDDDDIPF